MSVMTKLIVAKSMRDLFFGKLMDVYAEGNQENGRDLWPDEPEGRQIALAEQEFYQYLQQVFFRTKDARYLILEEDNRYISALRLEPYQDGLLLEALETAPAYRQKGYGAHLMQAAIETVGTTKVYSHVAKRNTASLRTHEKCGFVKILDHAVYADGSVNDVCCTLCHFPDEA